jgi:eukaryotic-like serine/threonine-protein kinase
MEPRHKGTDDELARTVAHIVRANAAHSARFAAQPGDTIQPSHRESGPAIGASHGFEMGPLLGQGGMGIVRRARQRVLDRDVAVKTVQPALKSEHVTRMLLQEALVLGRLEHPNILPIYDIQYDGSDAQIVLKKIDGVAWSSLMHDADVIRRLFAEEDPVDWNIGVLMQVCNAVHFAHSRGFVHRDLKPDNVMIGRFGEVYLMDWGLAVCTHDDGTGRFPLAKDATELAGTPQYMAPEMLGGRSSGISARTDVYLLGAMLYEIIARQAPHRGRDMAEMIREVIVSAPPLPDDCPLELARICRTAMEAEPSARYESAEALRVALSGFVQHAGSRRLSEQALRRTEELLSCLAQPAPHPRGLSERIQMLFGECRFAYRQALLSWPDNELAKAGQARALEAMIEYELGQHNPRSAAALLAGLDSPDPALRVRVERAVRAAESSERRMDELERLEKQLDVETGGRQRAIWAAGLGLVWTVAPAAGPWMLERFPDVRALLTLGFPLAVIGALLLLGYRARRDDSSVTRWLIRGGIVAMIGQLVLELTARALHLDPVQVEVLWPVVWFCVSAMLTATVDARLLPMTVGFLGAAFLGTVRPELRFFVMNGSNLIMTLNMFLIWMPRRQATPGRRGPDGESEPPQRSA